ncbi:MAG: hypothetical protein IKW49_08520 [Opitutales bacterium]|nr:hypothetical protein [Opitutales bacterium]
MNLIQKSVLLSASALLFALPDVCAISESEAINKTIWLNTGGLRGSLPAKQPKKTDYAQKPVSIDGKTKGAKQVQTKKAIVEAEEIQNDSSFWSNFDLQHDEEEAEWKLFMEAEILSVSPTKDMLYGTSADMVGLNLKFGGNQSLSEDLSCDLYCLCGYSYGEGEYLHHGSWWISFSEYSAFLAEISFGMNVRWHINDCFSVYAGGRIGGSVFLIEDAAYTSDPGFGLAYGLGVGLEWAFNERHAITFGYTFFGSTAESKIDTFVNESLSVGQQSFSAFSLGYKYTY